MSETSENLLDTQNSRREAAAALMKKDTDLSQAIERSFIKMKQYEERELMLRTSNCKLQTQLENLREGNQYLINAIAEETARCDELRKQINDCEARNAMERKENRNQLDVKALYYRNAICGAQDEYKTDNLKTDKRVYEMKIAGVLENYRQLEEEIAALKIKSENSSTAKQINEIDRFIEILENEDKNLIYEMRAEESNSSELNRQLKQLKIEVTQLQKKNSM